jgi:hypothetical protein
MTISASLTRIRSIAAVPLQRRRSQGSLRSLWFTVAFAMSVPALLLAIGIHSQEGRLVGAGALLAMGSVLLVGAWVMFLASLAEQAEFGSARLVPGFQRHLRLALALGVVASCAIEAVGFGVAFGQAVNAALFTLIALTLLTMALRWPWLVVALLVASLFVSPAASGATLPQLMLMFVAHRDVAGPVVLVACVVMFSIVAPTARRPARRSPDAPRRDDAGMPGARAGRAAAGRRDGVPVAPRTTFVQAWWADGRLPPATPDPLRRALSALPLDTHATFGWHPQWRVWLALLAVTSAMAIDALKDHVWLIFCGVTWMGLIVMAANVLGVRTGLGGSRSEQALMAMLPGVPSGPRLGRALALRLTATHAMGLLRGVIALAFIRAAMRGLGVGQDWFTSPAALAALPLACVPLTALFWTNWSTARALRASVFRMMLVLALLVGFAMLAPHLGWASLGAVAMLYIVPTVLWCAWRWHRLAVEPTVLPAGRLGA